jgi:catechol 2,3-dioxygenase-like lactoylglutathione lyase family enzyme
MDDIPILGVHEIAFEVEDLERSIAFYRDVLGLPLLSRGPQQAWFCIGAQRLALFTSDRPGSGQHFAFPNPAREDRAGAQRARGSRFSRRDDAAGRRLFRLYPRS